MLHQDENGPIWWNAPGKEKYRNFIDRVGGVYCNPMYENRKEIRIIAAELLNKVNKDLNVGLEPLHVENNEASAGSSTSSSAAGIGASAGSSTSSSASGNGTGLCHKDCLGKCKSEICLFLSGFLPHKALEHNPDSEYIFEMITSNFSSLKQPEVVCIPVDGPTDSSQLVYVPLLVKQDLEMGD
jgi:hypothetical protein